MSAPLILVVDDEPQIHRFLGPSLRLAGYTVEAAASGLAALRRVRTGDVDLVLLDLGLPDIDGQDLLEQLRQTSGVPVIVLSARDRVDQKVMALDAGASDYVEKPFDLDELTARIRAVLRQDRARAGIPETFRNPPLEIDFARRLVKVQDREIALTPKEYDVLALLARNAGRVVTHGQLLTEVWGPAHVNDVQYARVCVQHLRQKLGLASGQVMTVAGVGYRLSEA